MVVLTESILGAGAFVNGIIKFLMLPVPICAVVGLGSALVRKGHGR